jgi:Polyketide cyclase / dehydrase and lipid transport
MGHVQVSRLLPASVGDVFRHITDISNLPQWVGGSMEIEFPEPPPILREQSEFAVTFIRYGKITRSNFRVDELKPRERFAYRQTRGFFQSWVHTQVLVVHDPKHTLLTDLVDYRLPLGILGALVDDVFANKEIERLLTQRHLRIEQRFEGPG